MEAKTPISAIVVVYNEADLLKKCLESISFCDDIQVIDLESSDESAEIARQLGARVTSHSRVLIGEQVRHLAVPRARNDWVLITDPDEAVSPSLAEDIQVNVSSASDDISVISVPLQNFFLGRILKGTVWGGQNKRKRLIMHRQRARISQQVHSEFFIAEPGTHDLAIPLKNDNWLRHYWITKFSQLIEKHRRYLKLEGEAKYARGERFSLKQLVRRPVVEFYNCLIKRRGYRDGVTGVFLSFFWAWYNAAALLRLRAYQSKLKSHG